MDTFDKELIGLWNNIIPPYYIPNRNLLFTNIKAVYLIIGTAIMDLLDTSAKYIK